MKTICVLAIAILIAACAMLPPMPIANPVCERPEFSESWICGQLKAAGFERAEDFNNLIIDANDISLILEVYTVEQLAVFLDKAEKLIVSTKISYSDFLLFVMEETSKAMRVGSIMKRHFVLLQSHEIMRPSDVKLCLMAIESIRNTL